MRDYGKIHVSFWSSATIHALSDDGRLLALYLMTSPHTTIAGAFRLPDGYICEDLSWSAARVAEGFAELLSQGFANRCETTKWVWIVKHLTWNPPENPNQRKAAVKCVEQIPIACGWKRAFMRVCGPLLAVPPMVDDEPLRNPCETLAEPGTGTGTELKPPLPPDGGGVAQDLPASTPTPDPDGFDAFWLVWPTSVRKVARKTCAEKWRRKRLAASTALIVAHVEAMKLTRQWLDGFEPAPLTYLNGERWADGTPLFDTASAPEFV